MLLWTGPGQPSITVASPPLNAFLKVFKEEKGIEITLRQAREPMGMLKIDHIREILKTQRVSEQFSAHYRRAWTETDVREMNAKFETYLFATLKDFASPIPRVVETLDRLRAEGIKIGSTTGKEMNGNTLSEITSSSNIRISIHSISPRSADASISRCTSRIKKRTAF